MIPFNTVKVQKKQVVTTKVATTCKFNELIINPIDN